MGKDHEKGECLGIMLLLMTIFYLKVNCELFQTRNCATVDFSHVQDKIHVTEHYSFKPDLFGKAFM